MNNGINSQNNETEYVSGKNAVAELLRSGRTVNKLYIRRGDRNGAFREIIMLARERHIDVTEVELSRLDEMACGAPHRGIVASAAVHGYTELDDILAAARESEVKPLLIIADRIADPQNLGALLRVAEGAGAQGVIIPRHDSAGLTSAVGRASAGAIEHVPVARVGNLAVTVERLKQDGYWIYAAEAGGAPFTDCRYDAPTVIIVGSEGEGVSRLLRDKSDFTVSIPMFGHLNSLNVSTAAAIIVYDAALKLRSKQ